MPFSSHDWESNKRISEMRVNAVDNKNKIQYNLAYDTWLS